MADIAEPETCRACGRPLPLQQGKGRPRRYCDARCRDMARRRRERMARQSQQSVKKSLTTDRRQEYIDAAGGALSADDPVIARISEAAGRLADEFSGSGRPRDAVTAARDLAAAANVALQAAIDRARGAGYSWRDIGEALGTSRQAAFQRFGHPVDPRTGEPMGREVLPGAVERAVVILGWFNEGRWADVIAELDENVRGRLDPDQLVAGWTRLAAMFGRLERSGEPLAFRAGDDTMVEVPLLFEAGDVTGTVRFTSDGKVAGLGIRREST
jgi:hypothetical protein